MAARRGTTSPRVEVLTRAGIFAERTPKRIRSAIARARRRRQAARQPVHRRLARVSEGDAQRRACACASFCRKRIATQPLNLPNAGSVFRNPPGDHCGKAHRKLRTQGLRHWRRARVGEARELHRQSGRRREGADIEALIEHVRTVVRERTGVDLEPEVQVIGAYA
jgi:UDP-N-acetylmuramate dehydrogenase